MTAAPGTTVARHWLRPLVLVSAALYALGMVVLLSPVTTGIAGDDRISDGVGTSSRTCGVTLVQAFATPAPGLDGASRDSALDCAATARGRVGYGLLLLLVAAPAGVAALLTERRSSGRDDVDAR